MNAFPRIGWLGGLAPLAVLLLLGSFTAVASDTNIIAWPSGSLTNVPNLPTNPIAVTGGDTFCIALLADRTVQTWGYFELGGSIVPPADATDVVGIAAGSSHAVALRSDGTVVLWGTVVGNYSDQVPSEATNVIALGVGPGAQHVLVLRKNGTVVDWGLPITTNIPSEAFNIVSVAAGSKHSVALRSDGKVIAWGDDSFGAIDVPASATNVVAIATTWRGNIALRADGTVLTWGSNPGIPRDFTSGNVVEVAGSGVGGIVSGGGGMALKQNGTVGAATWPSPPTNIMAIGGSGQTYMTVKAVGPPIFPLRAVRRVVASGQTAYLRLRAVGALPMSYQWSFQGTNLPGATSEVLVVTNVVPGTVGYYSLVASNALGVITNSEMELSMVPFIITGQPTNQAVYVGASPTLSVTVLGESPSYQWWVHRATSIAGATNSSLTITNIQLTDAGTYRVSISNSFGVLTSSPAYISVSPILVTQSPQDQVMFRGGTATFNIAAQASSPLSYQWLFNGMELADTDTNTLTLPNVLYEQAGSYTVIASTTDAVVTNSATLSVVPVAAWGDNSSGQTDVPANLTNIIAIAGGGHHALVLKADGSVIAWGDNTYGQTNVPAGLTNVVAIAAGADHNLVLKTDGTVVSWGRNNYGQTNVPQDLTDIVAIGGGSAHSLALTSDGRVIAWGYNSYGQTNVPPDLTNAVAIAAGGYHNVALTDDGLVLAWGDNSNGQTNTPSGLTNVVVIGAGSFHSLAVTANGAGFAWGYNSYGQTNVPPDLTNAVATSGGLRHSLALRLDGTVTVWGGNTEGQTNVPAGLANVQAIAGGMYNCYALVGNGPPVVNGLPVNPVWSNHVFSVSLASQNNHVYRLEHKDSLADSAWVAHPLVAGTGGVLTLTDPTATGAQRFYRVRRW